MYVCVSVYMSECLSICVCLCVKLILTYLHEGDAPAQCSQSSYCAVLFPSKSPAYVRHTYINSSYKTYIHTCSTRCREYLHDFRIFLHAVEYPYIVTSMSTSIKYQHVDIITASPSLYIQAHSPDTHNCL